jgi:hypothetical protein
MASNTPSWRLREAICLLKFLIPHSREEGSMSGIVVNDPVVVGQSF